MGKDVSNEIVEFSGLEDTEISLITKDAVVKRIRKAKAEVVEKVHTDVTEPGHRDVDRSETACPSPPGCSIFAASCTRSCAGYVPVLPCIQLSKVSERKAPS